MRSKLLLSGLGLIAITLTNCAEKDAGAEWQPKEISKESLSDLDSINGLILQYADVLLESQKNHTNRLKTSKNEWAFTKPSLLEKYLPIEKNKLGYLQRHHPDTEAKSDVLINSIDFILSEQVFKYNVAAIIKGDTVIQHTLWKNSTPKVIEKIKPNMKHAQKLENNWLYSVQYTIDDEW